MKDKNGVDVYVGDKAVLMTKDSCIPAGNVGDIRVIRVRGASRMILLWSNNGAAMPTKCDTIEFPQKYAESVPHYLIYEASCGGYIAKFGWTRDKSKAQMFDGDWAEKYDNADPGKWLFEYCGHIARRIG